jgi:hypothetical protein
MLRNAQSRIRSGHRAAFFAIGYAECRRPPMARKASLPMIERKPAGLAGGAASGRDGVPLIAVASGLPPANGWRAEFNFPRPMDAARHWQTWRGWL